MLESIDQSILLNGTCSAPTGPQKNELLVVVEASITAILFFYVEACWTLSMRRRKADNNTPTDEAKSSPQEIGWSGFRHVQLALALLMPSMALFRFLFTELHSPWAVVITLFDVVLWPRFLWAVLASEAAEEKRYPGTLIAFWVLAAFSESIRMSIRVFYGPWISIGFVMDLGRCMVFGGALTTGLKPMAVQLQTRVMQSFDDLRQCFSYLWPSEEEGKSTTSGFRKYLIVSMGFVLLGRVLDLGMVILYKKIVDGLSGTASPPVFHWEVFIIYTLGNLWQGSSIGYHLQSHLWERLERHFCEGLHLRAFSRFHQLAVGWHLKQKPGKPMRLINGGIYGCTNVISMAVFNAFPLVIDVLIAIGYFATYLTPTLAGIALATAVPYGILSKLSSDLSTAYYDRYSTKEGEEEEDLEARAYESLSLFELVKCCNNEQREVDIYRKYLVSSKKSETTYRIKSAMYDFAEDVVMQVGLAMCTATSAFMIVGRQAGLTSGDFIVLGTYIVPMFSAVSRIFQMNSNVSRSLKDMAKMNKLLQAISDDEEIGTIQDAEGASELKVTDGHIRFENITFGYDPASPPIFRDLNFEVPPGKMVALVGPSGVGKSTIVRLLLRLYEPQGGRILIDGQDVTRVTQKSLRASIGIVPQEAALFQQATLRDNIVYGSEDLEVSDCDVERAAQAAGIHDRINKMTKGYKTLVGTSGLRLSGGERQRLAIARSILRDSPILVLDEATSALDMKTERRIQAALDAASAGRTTFVVAHRLATIVHAHQILVLDQGTVVEKGTHQELLNLKGHYHSLWNQ